MKYSDEPIKCRSFFSCIFFLHTNIFPYAVRLAMNSIAQSKKRKRSYNSDEVRATVRAYKAAKKFVNDHPSSTLSPIEIAQETSGGASKRQIERWIKMDNSDAARRNRLRHRGKKVKIKIEFQWLAIGHVLHRRSRLLVVHRDHVVEFLLNHLHLKVHREYVSKLLNKFGISVQRVLPRETRMTDEKVVDDAIELIAEIRREGWKPHNTYIMDETGLWSNVVDSYTYSPVNSCEFLNKRKFAHFSFVEGV